MFHTRNVADELAGIRSEISAQKQREQMLRDVVLSDPDSHSGQNHEVVIKKQKSRILLCDKLPAHILKNPTYWEEREEPHVTLRQRHRKDVVNLATMRILIQSQTDEPRAMSEHAVAPDETVASRRKAEVLRLVPLGREENDVLERFTG